jgi:hypothetical protein
VGRESKARVKGRGRFELVCESKDRAHGDRACLSDGYCVYVGGGSYRLGRKAEESYARGITKAKLVLNNEIKGDHARAPEAPRENPSQ